MGNDRRIVVVTGAGASRELGATGPMPLMTDWASSLTYALDQVEPESASAIGLREELPGEEFERNLGRFLAFQSQLRLTGELARLGGNDPHEVPNGFSRWHEAATHRCDRMLHTIRTNLFDQFGYRAFDDQKATDAYSALRKLLEAGRPDTQLAFATTNYDQTIETALEELGIAFDDGFPRTARSALQTLRPEGLARRWDPSEVPVLHLHGAVGWYRDALTRQIGRYPSSTPFNSSLGEPAILLPDAEKTVTSLVGAEQLWVEFRHLLDQATHVFVLGHSLNDRHLNEVIRENARNVAVSYYLPSVDFDPQDFAFEEDRVRSLFPGAVLVPCLFGPNPSFAYERVEDWLINVH